MNIKHSKVQEMACARARGLEAGRNLALVGTPITCVGGKPLEVFSFLHGAAEGHCLAMAELIEREDEHWSDAI